MTTEEINEIDKILTKKFTSEIEGNIFRAKEDFLKVINAETANQGCYDLNQTINSELSSDGFKKKIKEGVFRKKRDYLQELSNVRTNLNELHDIYGER